MEGDTGESSRSGSFELPWMGEMVVVIVAILCEDGRMWERRRGIDK